MKLYFLIISICIVITACEKQEAKVVNTTNANAQWNIDHFNNNYSSMKKIPEGLILIITIIDKELTLKLGESIHSKDHHSYRETTLLRTDSKGAYFTYESSFNHSSFGKHLIEIDKSVFFVSW